MSATTTTIVSPSVSPGTDRAVRVSQTLNDLAAEAQKNPVIKADMQAMFDSFSHNPLIGGLVTIAGVFLASKQVTVDSTVLTLAIGVAVTGIGYGWQWLSMRMRKPVPAAPVVGP